MKNTTKLLSAIAAGLVLSTGAYAQEAAPVSNLGPAVVGASQSEDGLFGSMGANGMALATVGIMAGTFFIAANAWEDEEAPAPDVEEPPPVTHH
jgi:hypothetical protein